MLPYILIKTLSVIQGKKWFLEKENIFIKVEGIE